MKILYKTMWLWLLSVCLSMFTAAPVAAKVCFVGEEGCAGGGSFDNYKDPGEDGELCTNEGYILKANVREKSILSPIARTTAAMLCAAARNIFMIPALILIS